MKIYTKSGDEGQTSLFGGLRVSKNDLRVQAYGELDELNSSISISLHYVKTEKIKFFLQNLQHLLFSIGSDLATPFSEKKLRESIHLDCKGLTKKLEDEIDFWETQLSPLKSFIVPGGSIGASHLHFLRTNCRRAERIIIQLSKSEDINKSIIPYINRLSDLFFVLARAENHSLDINDVVWDQNTE
ncbi:MAG: Cob(I)yrinic acid a,c-diamide adenosyltransferase [Candidatus Heimdallarchaeota archaeon LC_3]|nr:MAG: Cob(I)yrinic acid a,c-diamide adenosyltransferase [Candidatus Heimdallarchaeota archaeon LC_3]